MTREFFIDATLTASVKHAATCAGAGGRKIDNKGSQFAAPVASKTLRILQPIFHQAAAACSGAPIVRVTRSLL